MIGIIIKIHSDFYYVRADNNVFECKIRERLKKENIEIYVGDRVKLEEINTVSNQAVIANIEDRKNFIQRPAIANIDQIVLIASLDQPKLDFNQLDRYLVNIRIHNIPVVICINKYDLEDNQHIKNLLISTYEPLGYKIIFTSAISGLGLDEMKNVLDSKISVFSGASGVGKSSLLNKLHPGLTLKTKEISPKTLRGTHATRHSELIDIPLDHGKISQVADTPGFSYLKFDNIMPNDIKDLFSEIHELSQDCYYNNCLHLEETGCNVLKNLNNISSSRYESYKAFVNEALGYKEKISQTGHKVEKNYKNKDIGDKEKIKIIKVSSQSREKSRSTHKQKLNFISDISSLDDISYNND